MSLAGFYAFSCASVVIDYEEQGQLSHDLGAVQADFRGLLETSD